MSESDPVAQGVPQKPSGSSRIDPGSINMPAWPIVPPPGARFQPPELKQEQKKDEPAPKQQQAPQAPPAWIDDVNVAVPSQWGAPPQYMQQPPQHVTQAPQYGGYGPVPYDPAVANLSPQDRAFYELVHRPEDWVRGMARSEVEQIVAPVYGEVQRAASQISQYLKDQATVSERNAKTNVKRLYTEVIQNDEDYNSNPAFRVAVDRSFEGLLKNSMDSARNGRFEDISRLASLSNLEARAALNGLKTLHGSPGSVTSGPQMGTAFVERPTAQVPDSSVELTREEEAAIAWREHADPGFRERYIESKKIALERGDWQF